MILDRPDTAIVDSNPARGMDVSALCRHVKVEAQRWADPPSKESYKCLNGFIVSGVNSNRDTPVGRGLVRETHNTITTAVTAAVISAVKVQEAKKKKKTAKAFIEKNVGWSASWSFHCDLYLQQLGNFYGLIAKERSKLTMDLHVSFLWHNTAACRLDSLAN